MTLPPTVALDKTFTYRLHLLHKLTDRASQATHTEKTGMRLSEARCLSAVGAFAPLSVNDLAARANLNKGQASRAAQALVVQGLVRKQIDRGDARAVRLALTAKGRTAWLRVMAVVAERNEAILRPLSAKEQASFTAMLDRLIDAAKNTHAANAVRAGGTDDE
jgi:DNA-binding MarR family transcriptional regulator